MKFDKSKVYTALNADELKEGSKVIAADTLGYLKSQVEDNDTSIRLMTLDYICSEEYTYRFVCDGTDYALAYLVEEPEGLKWTDLKVGDVIRLSSVDSATFNERVIECMITEIDGQDTEARHIRAGVTWLTDKQLKRWEKVE